MTPKRNFYQMHQIHPATPRRLVSEFHKAGWNERELARRRGVNIKYISDLIRRGIEPTDRTIKGQEARVALFLPRLKRKPRVVKERPVVLSPEWWDELRRRAVRAMRRNTKRAVIRKDITERNYQ
jgi:hypothetical protein